MPPRKRGVPEASEEAAPKRRSLRQAASKSQQEQEPAPATRTNPTTKPTKTAAKKEGKEPNISPEKKNTDIEETKKSKKTTKKQDSKTSSGPRAMSEDPDIDSIPTTNPDAPKHDGQWYWLMKAEPESRIENGVDVKFSIDDLKAKTEPEGWDGESSSLYA